MAVIEGDLATDRDAERLARLGVPVVQINTKGGCPLEANVVEKAMESLPLDTLDVLFIENVGHLVCPAEFDRGADFNVAVRSAPEGADNPLKYPYLFTSAKAVLLTKTDLLPHLSFDMEMFAEDTRKLNPAAPVFHVDSLWGAGIDQWGGYIKLKAKEKKANVR